MRYIHYIIPKIVLLLVFTLFANSSYSQKKSIVIEDELALNSEKMKVKMGTQWMGRIWRFKFGDYEVAKKSKMSTRIEKGSSNLLGTKSEYSTNYNFDFILCNKDSDSVYVKAEYRNIVQELSSFELFRNVQLGSNEILKDSINLYAELQLDPNQNNKWGLFLDITSGTESEYLDQGVLTDGSRVLYIDAVSSDDEGDDKRWYPALGYQITENGKAISAVQYFGGGSFGYNKNVIWIDKRLDSDTKMILAAAMTAIMQVSQVGIN